MADLREGLQNSLGSAFTVERELTGGGMSRVFVALETSLGRRVVVKVLPAELAASVSVDRFKREINLAATLQHPHIVGVLAAGEIDGMPYFTMPFVDGESVRVRIEREGRLTVGRTVSILKDVARALAYAHERGVVHRDIKPDNVLLAGTSATVTDFGIAKAVLGALATDPSQQSAHVGPSGKTTSKTGALTQLGTTLGTPAYMAPEQAAADPATDHRADIYSFGIMAYEMLTGHVPFKSKTPQALLAAQLTATPPPMTASRNDVPLALAQLVMQCLEKERDKRPQTARELAELLENPEMVSGAFASASQLAAGRPRRIALYATAAVAVIAAAVTAGIVIARRGEQSRVNQAAQVAAAAAAERGRSIVVLPFVNIGRDTSDEYLAEGLTNDLINVIGRVPGIRVTSRSVAVSAQQKFSSATEIGKALNVGKVLEGTVQRDGNRLRVTARVTNADDGFMVWSDMFERELKDVFAVQDEISRAIADALGAQIAEEAPVQAASSRGTTDDVAYDLYLRGRHFFDQRGEQALRRSLDLFRRATQRDPNFARAYAGIAGVHSVLPLYSRASSDSLFGPGLDAATKAIELDSSLADAYASRALLYNTRWQWAQAEEDFKRAIALDPRSATAHQWYGEQLLARNRIPEALTLLKRATDLDPVSPVIASSYAMMLALSRRDSEAIAQGKRALELDSALFVSRLILGVSHMVAGRSAEAIKELEPALGLSGNSPLVQGMLGHAYAGAGLRQNAEAMAQQLAAAARQSPDAGGSLAVVQIALGDTASALTLLENAARARSSIFTVQPLAFPMFDPVRASPRFQAIQRALGIQ
jgi:TolB-like protein/Tfp pilus assembly protein PilF